MSSSKWPAKLSKHEGDVVLASFYSLKPGFTNAVHLSIKEETKKTLGDNFVNNIVKVDEWREKFLLFNSSKPRCQRRNFIYQKWAFLVIFIYLFIYLFFYLLRCKAP